MSALQQDNNIPTSGEHQPSHILPPNNTHQKLPYDNIENLLWKSNQVRQEHSNQYGGNNRPKPFTEKFGSAHGQKTTSIPSISPDNTHGRGFGDQFSQNVDRQQNPESTSDRFSLGILPYTNSKNVSSKKDIQPVHYASTNALLSGLLNTTDEILATSIPQNQQRHMQRYPEHLMGGIDLDSLEGNLSIEKRRSLKSLVSPTGIKANLSSGISQIVQNSLECLPMESRKSTLPGNSLDRHTPVNPQNQNHYQLQYHGQVNSHQQATYFSTQITDPYPSKIPFPGQGITQSPEKYKSEGKRETLNSGIEQLYFPANKGNTKKIALEKIYLSKQRTPVDDQLQGSNRTPRELREQIKNSDGRQFSKTGGLNSPNKQIIREYPASTFYEHKTELASPSRSIESVQFLQQKAQSPLVSIELHQAQNIKKNQQNIQKLSHTTSGPLETNPNSGKKVMIRGGNLTSLDKHYNPVILQNQGLVSSCNSTQKKFNTIQNSSLGTGGNASPSLHAQNSKQSSTVLALATYNQDMQSQVRLGKQRFSLTNLAVKSQPQNQVPVTSLKHPYQDQKSNMIQATSSLRWLPEQKRILDPTSHMSLGQNSKIGSQGGEDHNQRTAYKPDLKLRVKKGTANFRQQELQSPLNRNGTGNGSVQDIRGDINSMNSTLVTGNNQTQISPQYPLPQSLQASTSLGQNFNQKRSASGRKRHSQTKEELLEQNEQFLQNLKMAKTKSTMEKGGKIIPLKKGWLDKSRKSLKTSDRSSQGGSGVYVADRKSSHSSKGTSGANTPHNKNSSTGGNIIEKGGSLQKIGIYAQPAFSSPKHISNLAMKRMKNTHDGSSSHPSLSHCGIGSGMMINSANGGMSQSSMSITMAKSGQIGQKGTEKSGAGSSHFSTTTSSLFEKSMKQFAPRLSTVLQKKLKTGLKQQQQKRKDNQKHQEFNEGKDQKAKQQWAQEVNEEYGEGGVQTEVELEYMRFQEGMISKNDKCSGGVSTVVGGESAGLLGLVASQMKQVLEKYKRNEKLLVERCKSLQVELEIEKGKKCQHCGNDKLDGTDDVCHEDESDGVTSAHPFVYVENGKYKQKIKIQNEEEEDDDNEEPSKGRPETGSNCELKKTEED